MLSHHVRSIGVSIAVVNFHDHGKTSDRKRLIRTNLASTTDAKISISFGHYNNADCKKKSLAIDDDEIRHG
jgi:hypothetical protein